MKNLASMKSHIGLVLTAISTTAFAAPPQMGSNYNYGGWTVNNGVVDTSISCSASGVAQCKPLSSDNGFLQEEVQLSDGQKFIRIIMTDPGATGDPTLSGASADLKFASEGFTTYLSSGDCNAIAGSLPNNFQDCQGVAIKQDVRDLTKGFESTAVVQRNFAKSNEAPNLDNMFNILLSQTIDTVDSNTGLAFQSGFNYKEYSYWECQISGDCSNSQQIGKSMSQSSTIYLDPTDNTKKQKFYQVKADGWAGRQSGGYYQSTPVVNTGGATESVTIGGRTINGVTTGTPTTFSWNSGGGFGGGTANAIETTWIGADLVDSFDYQSVKVNGSSDSQILLDPLGSYGTPTNPFDWAPSMGPQPTF